MSSPDGFKRCNGFAGSIPQNFINANMPVCPMCGSADPYWTLKDKLEFTAHRILFRCKDCGCVISATQDDFSGTTKSTAYAVLTTGGAVNALVKKKQGKDVKTVYMKVEDAGSAQTSSAFVGKELPIDEFKAMAAAFGAPAAPAAEEAPAPEAAPVEATEPEIKVTYAAPAAPQAEPEVKVSYAAPAPAPVAPAPKAKKAKAPVASIIFTVFAMLGVFCTIGIDIVPLFLPHFGLPGGIAYTAKIGLTTVLGSIQLLGMLLFLIGLFLHRKKGNILCGIGVALNVLPIIADLVSRDALLIISSDLIIATFLIIAAVFYFTKAKVLGMPLKLVFGLLAILFAFVFAGGVSFLTTSNFAEMMGYTPDLEGLFNTFTQIPHITFTVLGAFASAFTSLWFYLSIVLFTPKKG